MAADGPAERVRLSVVIPTLDEEATLGVLLARLTPCDGHPDRPDEVVVCDGGSVDATVELARARSVRVVDGPAGRGTQLRRGALASDGDVLLFLHADCLPAPGALQALRAALQDPGCTWGGLSQEIDAPGAFFRLAAAAARARVRCFGLVYGDCGLFVRRETYVSVGGFAEIPLFEDLDLSRRLRARAWPRTLRHAKLLVSARRWQAEGVLRATLRNWIIQAAYLAGVRPWRLARFYPRAAQRSRGRQVDQP